MASWLSPDDARTFQQLTQSENPLVRQQLDKLSTLLYTLLNEGPNFTLSFETSLLLEESLAKQKLETEKAATTFHQRKQLPHRIYSLSLSHDGVSWIAKADYPGNTSLVGRGDCPASALNDFDEQWLGIK
jgi:hypothetical protein